MNVPAETLIDVAPSSFGVNSAEYKVILTAVNLVKTPPVTLMSEESRPVTSSLTAKVTTRLESLVVRPVSSADPSVVAAVITISGAILS